MPKPVDVVVGGRVRIARNLKRMSQTALGDALGLTFQQIQKYERGSNRVSCSTLAALADVLEQPIAWFFGEQSRKQGADIVARMLLETNGVELAQAFLAIDDAADRRAVLHVAHLAARQRRASRKVAA